MSVTLTGSGGLFTRLGKIVGEYQRVVSGYGVALTNGVEGVWDQYPNSDEDGVAIDGLIAARNSYRTVHGSYLSSLVSTASNTVIEQVNRDNVLPSKTLVNALTELKRQMVANTTTIQKPTVSVSASAWGSNKGNAVVNVSSVNEYGDQLDMVFSEDVKLTVSADTSTGGTQYAETLTIAGEPAKAVTDYQWSMEGGSGASGSMTINDATTTGLITDGGFESWSSSTTPTYWTVTTGAATVARNAANVIRGSYSLAITSDGSTLTAVRQQVASTISTNRVYAINVWMKMSATDGSGQVRIRLTNSAGTVLVDDAGNNLQTTVGLNGGSGVDTSFTKVSAFFSTPRQLPATGGVYLEIAFTTAPSSPKVLYVDHISFVRATQLYTGGPYVAAFSKDTPNAKGDYYTVAVANSFPYNSFARALDRFFSMRSLGLYLPSTSGSATVSDALIQ